MYNIKLIKYLAPILLVEHYWQKLYSKNTNDYGTTKKTLKNVSSNDLSPSVRNNLSVIELYTTWIQLNVLSRVEILYTYVNKSLFQDAKTCRTRVSCLCTPQLQTNCYLKTNCCLFFIKEKVYSILKTIKNCYFFN